MKTRQREPGFSRTLILLLVMFVVMTLLPSEQAQARRWKYLSSFAINTGGVCIDGMELMGAVEDSHNYLEAINAPWILRLQDSNNSPALPENTLGSGTIKMERSDTWPDFTHFGRALISWDSQLPVGTRLWVSIYEGAHTVVVTDCRLADWLSNPPPITIAEHVGGPLRIGPNGVHVSAGPPVVGRTDTLTTTLDLSGSFRVNDLSVGLSFSHAEASELEVTLIAPNGARAILLKPDTLQGQQEFRSDGGDCAISIFSLYSPPTPLFFNSKSAFRLGQPAHASLEGGAFASDEPEALAAFHSLPAQGRWTLEIRDLNPLLNDGTLRCWSIEVRGAHSVYLPLVRS